MPPSDRCREGHDSTMPPWLGVGGREIFSEDDPSLPKAQQDLSEAAEQIDQRMAKLLHENRTAFVNASAAMRQKLQISKPKEEAQPLAPQRPRTHAGRLASVHAKPTSAGRALAKSWTREERRTLLAKSKTGGVQEPVDVSVPAMIGVAKARALFLKLKRTKEEESRDGQVPLKEEPPKNRFPRSLTVDTDDPTDGAKESPGTAAHSGRPEEAEKFEPAAVELEDVALTSLEIMEKHLAHRRVADSWIFTTCPLYTHKVCVVEPNEAKMRKDAGEVHRRLVAKVERSLAKKAETGDTCGTFNDWLHGKMGDVVRKSSVKHRTIVGLDAHQIQKLEAEAMGGINAAYLHRKLSQAIEDKTDLAAFAALKARDSPRGNSRRSAAARPMRRPTRPTSATSSIS